MNGGDVATIDRIVQLSAGVRLLVFGFWTGALPEVSRLHFRSVARALPADSRYILFTSNTVIPQSMQAVLDADRIEVVPIDFRRLMRAVGAAPLIRWTPLSPCWPLAVWFARRPGWSARLSWFCHHRTRRTTPRANVLLGGPPLHETLMSDYMRVVISSIVPGHTLYTDIDVAFPRSLDWIFQFGSFAYRWERFPYANNALMSVTEGCGIKNGKLLALMKREGTAKPWILLDDENCRNCGLDILSCDWIDPLWSRARLDGIKFSDFFTCTVRSSAELRYFKRQFNAVHWHNKWDKVPEPGSAYDLMLRELESDAAVPALPRELS
ncbi:MAG: hypothetical protein R3D05_15880 [Dongiaceae bacterium]